MLSFIPTNVDIIQEATHFKKHNSSLKGTIYASVEISLECAQIKEDAIIRWFCLLLYLPDHGSKEHINKKLNGVRKLEPLKRSIGMVDTVSYFLKKIW